MLVKHGPCYINILVFCKFDEMSQMHTRPFVEQPYPKRTHLGTMSGALYEVSYLSQEAHNSCGMGHVNRMASDRLAKHILVAHVVCWQSQNNAVLSDIQLRSKKKA